MEWFQRIKSIGGGKLFKSFSVYVFSSVFNQGVSFLLIPVLTHYLLPSEYGVLSLVNTTVSLMTIFIMVGSDGAIRRAFFKLKGTEYSNFFTSAFLTSVIAFFIVALLTALFVLVFNGDAGIPARWVLLSPVIAFASILPTILLGQFRVRQEAAAFAVVSNTMTIANLGLAIAFVAGIGLNYDGRLYSTLLVNAVFFVISYFILKKDDLLTGTITKKHCRDSLRYGLPIIPHQVGAFIIGFSDRYFIANLVNIPEVGIYNIGYLVGGIVGIAEGAFGYAFTPFLFESLTEGSEASKRRVVKVSYLFLIFLGICVLLLHLSTGLLFDIFIDEKFHQGQRFVLWVAIGYFFAGCYKVFTGYIFYSGKTIYLTYLAFVNIGLNLFLNYVLISRYGAMGAAYSSCLSYFVMFLLTAAISNRLVRMPWLSVFKKS